MMGISDWLKRQGFSEELDIGGLVLIDRRQVKQNHTGKLARRGLGSDHYRNYAFVSIENGAGEVWVACLIHANAKTIILS